MIIKTVSNTLIILISGLINLAPKNHRFNRKAPATPHTTRADGGRSGRAPSKCSKLAGNVSILGKAVCTGNGGPLYKISYAAKFRIV